MGQEIAISGEMTITLEYETRIEQESRKKRKSVLLLVSQENPMELVSQGNPMELVTATTTKNSPKVLTKRKGHSASIVRSGGTYLHSAQIKQKMLTTVGNGTKEKTREEQQSTKELLREKQHPVFVWTVELTEPWYTQAGSKKELL